MRSIAIKQAKEFRSKGKKEQQKKEREARIKKFKGKKELARKMRKTIEWERVQKDYPDDLHKQLILKNVHHTLRTRFLTKCVDEEATMAGKLRYFMWACSNGKVDDIKLNELMDGLTTKKMFGPIPKNTAHVFCVTCIPITLHRDFKKWCRLRGYTMSGKLKQLMIGYLKGIVG